MKRAKSLKVNAGTEPDADLGPVISKQASILYSFVPSFYIVHSTGKIEAS